MVGASRSVLNFIGLHHIQLWQRLKRDRQKVFNLCLLLAFISILLLALIPGQRRFETQVIATQMSFETALPIDEPSRRFFDSIRNLEAISLTGSHPTPLTLTGQFSSDTLGNLTELTFELPYDTSQIAFQPIGDFDADSPRELEVLALRLQNQTSVDAFRYVPFERHLELRFTHADPPKPIEGSFLELYLGRQPMQLTLEGYRLSTPSKVLEDPDSNRPLTLIYKPNIAAELALALPKIGAISLSLPPLTNLDTLRWFWGKMPVTRLAFTTEERREADTVQRSTIISGKVRMGEQELEIESDQFLLLEEPGIQQLRYLRLVDDQGIEVRAMGETALAQIGLDPEFPIRGLRSNIIAQQVRPDVVVAIVSFAGAMVASLLSWFVENLFKSSEPEKE